MLPKFTSEKPINISSEFDNQLQNHRALLSSNETVPQDFFKNMETRPDGSLVGVGIGMSLGMLEAFENGPQNIVLFDINQHVVASGRIFIEMLKQSEDFESFQANLKNQDLVESLYKKVTQDEPLLKDQNANFYDLTQFIHDQFFNFTKKENPQIHQSVERKFSQIKQLAENNKFNIYLGDISNNEWTNALSEHIAHDPGTHLFYLSNTPDFICVDQSSTRGLNTNLDYLSSNLRSPAVWIDTLSTSKYVLNSHSNPPHFRSLITSEHSSNRTPQRGLVDYLETHSLNEKCVIKDDCAIIKNTPSSFPSNNELIIPLNSDQDWSILFVAIDDKIKCTIRHTGKLFADSPEHRKFLASFLPKNTEINFTIDDDIIANTVFDINQKINLSLPDGKKICVQPDKINQETQFTITSL